jgi:DNA-binding IclR family transcriptional regulator
MCTGEKLGNLLKAIRRCRIVAEGTLVTHDTQGLARAEPLQRSNPVIQAVDRALRVLAVLRAARWMSLSEIAGQLDLAPSTVHGLIRTLLQHGMVQQEIGSGRYRLGPATLRLGNVYLDTLELRSRALVWAEDLAARTDCAVRAGVLLCGDVTEVMVVAHEPRPAGGRQMPEVGIVIPAHASALGKALLAFDDTARAELLGPGPPLRGMTGVTVTDRAALGNQLRAVRETAIALEAEEAVLGECSAATPIADATDEVVGALALVVPGARWPLPASTLDALRAAARAVSRELGARHWPPPDSRRSAAS